MTWLLVDVETSGLDPQRDHLIEVGLAHYSESRGVIIGCESRLVRAPSNAAEKLNRIPYELLDGERERIEIDEWVRNAAFGVDFILAHNAAFDRQWLPDLGAPWICTCDEADWPRAEREGAGLTAIALAYDVGVVRAHRAIEDVLTLAAVLTRVHEIEGGLGAWLARALEPRIELIALTSYDEREQTKAEGFRWDPARKVWWRKVRASRLEAVRAELGFRTREAA